METLFQQTVLIGLCRWYAMRSLARLPITLLVACLAASVTSCSAVEGYQRLPEGSAAIGARRELFYGLKSDDKYYEATGTSRRVLRDTLVYGKMQVLQDDFIYFERSLNSAGNYVSLSSDLAVLMLNGLGATTGSAGTKSALAAASAGVVGTQGVVNKDLYYQKTIAALISQMQANREKVRLAIVQNLRSPDDLYPLSAAEIDLKRLQEAGSLINAVNDISEQAIQQKTNHENQISDLQKLTSSNSETANKLRTWLYQNGKVNMANFAALQKWLNNQPETFLKNQNYPPAALVGDTPDADLEPIRARACADPDLKID